MGAIATSRSLVLARSAIRTLVWKPENLDLALTGRWLLNDAPSREFGLV